MRKIAKKILIAAVLLLLAGVSSMAMVVKLRHGQLLSVQSQSMTPAYNKGDLVIVNRIPEQELRVGDVITFINPVNKRTTITHRIVEIRRSGRAIITKGDANARPDAMISSKAVVGRVSYSLPLTGFAIDFIRQPLGLVLLIYIPALAVVVSELRRLAKYFKESQPYLLFGIGGRIGKAERPMAVGMAKRSLMIILLLGLVAGVSVPLVRAALQTSATLSGNTISTQAAGGGGDGTGTALISKLYFRCSPFNETTAAQRPRIDLYNPGNSSVDISGWKLQDNSGTVLTLPNKILKKHHRLVVRLLLPGGGSGGLQYAGDRLVLVNAANQKIDGLSWGTDTTELNPSLGPITPGTRLRRKPLNLDTNKAADWQLRDQHCAHENEAANPSAAANNLALDDTEEVPEDRQDAQLDPTAVFHFDLQDRDSALAN